MLTNIQSDDDLAKYISRRLKERANQVQNLKGHTFTDLVHTVSFVYHKIFSPILDAVLSAVYVSNLSAYKMSARLQRIAPKLAMPTKSQWSALTKLSFLADQLQIQLDTIWGERESLRKNHHHPHQQQQNREEETDGGNGNGEDNAPAGSHDGHSPSHDVKEIIENSDESMASYHSSDMAKFCIGEPVIIGEEAGVPCSVAGFAEVAAVKRKDAGGGRITWLYDLDEATYNGKRWAEVQESRLYKVCWARSKITQTVFDRCGEGPMKLNSMVAMSLALTEMKTCLRKFSENGNLSCILGMKCEEATAADFVLAELGMRELYELVRVRKLLQHPFDRAFWCHTAIKLQNDLLQILSSLKLKSLTSDYADSPLLALDRIEITERFYSLARDAVKELRHVTTRGVIFERVLEENLLEYYERCSQRSSNGGFSRPNISDDLYVKHPEVAALLLEIEIAIDKGSREEDINTFINGCSKGSYVHYAYGTRQGNFSSAAKRRVVPVMEERLTKQGPQIYKAASSYYYENQILDVIFAFSRLINWGQGPGSLVEDLCYASDDSDTPKSCVDNSSKSTNDSDASHDPYDSDYDAALPLPLQFSYSNMRSFLGLASKPQPDPLVSKDKQLRAHNNAFRKELFEVLIWPELSSNGWKVVVKEGTIRQEYWLPPGVEIGMNGSRNGIDYFDSTIQVLSAFKFRSSWVHKAGPFWSNPGCENMESILSAVELFEEVMKEVLSQENLRDIIEKCKRRLSPESASEGECKEGGNDSEDDLITSVCSDSEEWV